MKKKILILTALKHDLKKYKNIFFLGEWCLPFNKNKFSKNKKIRTFTHHWTSLKKLKKDDKSLRIKYENLLKHLSKNLNNFHSTNYSKEYWRVIVGPWLYFYLVSMFDRWESSNKIFRKKKDFDVAKYDFNPEVLYNYDTFSFWEKATQSDLWNQANYQRIITYRSKNKFKFVDGLIRNKRAFKSKIKKKKFLNIGYFLRKMFNLMDSFISRISLNINKIYMETVYFSKLDVIKLFLKCRIIPAFNLSTFKYEPKELNFDFDNQKRNTFFKYKNLSKDDFTNFLNLYLIKDLPVIFLEDFKKIEILNKKFNNLKLKSIFSTGSHIFNERYKIWLAKMIQKGSDHYVMSHGGCLPLLYVNNLFEHELKISKKYISWHRPIHKKQIRMTSIQLLKTKRDSEKQKLIKKEKTKCLILSCTTIRYPIKIIGWPYVEQYKIWVNDLSNMIKKFDQNIKKNVVYRCGGAEYGFNTDEILKKKHKLINISKTSKETFEDVISNAKITICTYPETVISECLIYDAPMIISISPKIHHFMPQIKKIIDELENKIFFSDPRKAAKFVNSIWNNPNQWWQDKDTKKAVKKLKDYTFKTNDNWLDEWKRIIKGIK